MTRIKRGIAAKKKRKKIIEYAKGYTGSHAKLFRTANQQVMKALRYSYLARQKRLKNFRKIWINRINITSRLINKIKYNILIKKFKQKKILINKKIISNLCINDIKTFKLIIEL